ncbi:hypothetical protein BDW60DRAFT_214723 [Aspergillus nidulans var. acristatus]
MTRVPRRSVSVLARRSPGLIARRKARKHKVILESVTQEKKKLRSVISFEAKAPPGYTFISAGDPFFTTTCKERCRRDGLKVYAVSTTPHLHTHGLSQHVHRIGYHFPSAVVADVCINHGLYLTETGKAVAPHSIRAHEASRKLTDSDSQITINTEARDVLKDLFPNIPDNDLNQIIKTAFQKGQRKVGTAVELPLARRAQLAVVAHIRHIYTDYDRLLKTTSFHEARAAVEQPTLAKLVEWRGDDENGKTVLEDVFREVIVISDDDDSDNEGEPQQVHGRETSVEIISSNPVIEELQMRPVHHGSRAVRDAQVENSEDEAAPGFRFVPEAPKKIRADRRGFSRYQAWDRAINRYRNMASGAGRHPTPYSATGEPSQETPGLGREALSRRPIHPRHSSVAPVAPSNQRAVAKNMSRPPLNTVAEHCFQREPYPSNSAVLTLDEPYEMHPLDRMPEKRRDVLAPFSPPFPLQRAPKPEPMRHLFQRADLPNGPVFVSGPKESLERNGNGLRLPPRPQVHLQNRIVTPQDHVLPSIENPLPMEIKRPNSGHIEHLTKRMSGAFTFRSVTPHRQVHHDFPSRTFPQEPVGQDHISKRRRLAYHEPTLMEKPLSPNGPPLSTHPGTRYARPFVQSGPHVRRPFVSPTEARRIAQHEPDITHDSFSTTARFGREQHTLAHLGSFKAYDGQQSSYNHLVNTQAAYDRSPVQARTASDARYTAAGSNGYDRNLQPHLSDLPEHRVSHNIQVHDGAEVRALGTSGTWLEPVWRSNNIMLSKPGEENHRLHADGFVRAVGHGDPGTLGYRPARPHPSRHMVHNLSQPVNARLHDVQHQRVPSDSLASMPPRGRSHVDFLGKTPLQQDPAISSQVPGHQDGRRIRTPPSVYQDRRQPKNTVVPSRYGQNKNPILIGT